MRMAKSSSLGGTVKLRSRAQLGPPATFFFLRNQMRDTVRILFNGYPLFVALSMGGWVLLCRTEVAGFHRRLLVAWGLTYVLMLIFKDPALFPMIFLHAKEDLFYASLACLLGGLPIAGGGPWRWRRARVW